MPTIGDIQQIYAAGFNLEDVKITLDHDLKMDVAGIKIDAREGEIISIPRWAALILENEKHCTIQETNMIVELKQALGKENALNEYELSTLEDEFYIKLNAYIERLDKDEQKEAKDLLNTLFRTRHGKLIRLADSSPLTADLSKRMTVEEKLYEHAGGDMRHAINIMQAVSSMGGITAENVKKAAGLSKVSDVDTVMKSALAGKTAEAREKMIEVIKVYGVSVSDFLKYAAAFVFKSEIAADEYGNVLETLAKYDYRILAGANPEIQLSAMLAELGKRKCVKRVLV